MLIWRGWNDNLLIWTALLATLAVYAAGVTALWHHAGLGRGVRLIQAVAFVAGWTALVVALASPLERWSGLLLSAHMVQHLLLVVVAPPLLLWGAPPFVLAWALPAGQRRGFGLLHGAFVRRLGLRALFAGFAPVWLMHTAALWVWHAPSLYDAALARPALHILEHASFVTAALLFWWVALNQRTGDRVAVAIVFVFTTALQSGLLGALITLAPTVLYSHYATTAPLVGVAPLTDQQVAGVIMWVPMGFVYLGTVLWLINGWLQRHGDAASAEASPREIEEMHI